MAPSRRRLLVALFCVWTVVVSFRLAVRGIRASFGDRPWLARPVRIDVNRASVDELSLLPGIGAGRAAAIVLHRVRYGPFRRVEDISAVDGVGEATVRRLEAFVTVEPR